MKIGKRKHAILTSEALNETLRKTPAKIELNTIKASTRESASGTERPLKKYSGHDLDQAVNQRMKNQARSLRGVSDYQNTDLSPYSNTYVAKNRNEFDQNKSSKPTDTIVGLRTGQFDEKTSSQVPSVHKTSSRVPSVHKTPEQASSTMMSKYVNNNLSVKRSKRPKLVIKNGKLLISKPRHAV